ncbi:MULTISPECIES: carbohydrate ABC transporter permease [Trueperella]|uniref:Multiple sugar transport system permease protein n=1 Tax=Trueperella abortisuis TaxID=445930 RepID=A0ABT9PFL7_9ACTO|nr:MULTISPECIES: sugar ABC transporter permease [Trueperella]MCI7305964.1 sugar ABC transporter permease [Trueperella sp.]MDP9831499.1 multiple sugar transport system permease protein [Trueperella abortisuis]
MSTTVKEPPATTHKHRRTKREAHEARTGWLFMAPFAVLFTFIFVIPIIVSIYKAFFQTRVVGGGAFGGGDSQQVFVGFDNFAYVVGSDVFWAGIGRVILYTLFQVPVMIGLALVLALLIDSFILRHVTIYRLSYFLPYAVPGVVAAIIWMYIYTPTVSPLNSLFDAMGVEFPIDFFSSNVILASMANMTTWTFAGYNMLIFLAALQAIPRDLYEAARVDGASSWQIVRYIKIPMVRGAALLAILLSIVGTIQLYNEPAVLATKNTWMGQAYTPLMMALNTAKGYITPSGDGPASAIAIMMAIIAGVLAVIYFLTDRKVNGND